MTALAPHLSTFLREHLPRERRASQHTCEAYAYSFQLLVCFAADRLRIQPSRLEIERIDAPLILAFLEHIERERGNSARTRNARLAAVNSFFRFLEYRLPACLDQARRIHAIPMKKTDEALVGYLMASALVRLRACWLTWRQKSSGPTPLIHGMFGTKSTTILSGPKVAGRLSSLRSAPLTKRFGT